MGGGTWRDAATLLLQHPPLWAAVLGLTLSTLNVSLPAALDSVSAVLAPAHRPLALLAAGMTLSVAMPQPRMVRCAELAVAIDSCRHRTELHATIETIQLEMLQ